MKLGIPVYQGVDLLDVAGPWEMFNWVDKAKGLETVILTEDGGPVTTMNGITFNAHASFADTPALDILWVPGGDPKVLGQVMSDPASPYIAYLQQVAGGATWVCSVCEGALLAARAGLLDGTPRPPTGRSSNAFRHSPRSTSIQPTRVTSFRATA